MVDKSTLAFIWALVPGIVILFVVLALFSYLRPRRPIIFDFRRTLTTRDDIDALDCNGQHIVTPPPVGDGWFGAFKAALAYSDDEMVESHGLDMVMYLRMQKVMFGVFSVATLLTAAVLYPVYATAGNKDLPKDDASYVAGLDIISMANVPTESARYWATAVVDVILTAIVISAMAKLYAEFASRRIAYRKKNWPTSYAVVCMDLPANYTNSKSVYDYFDGVFPGEVLDVNYVQDGTEILNMKKLYWKAVSKREGLEYKFSTPKGAAKGRPEHRPAACGACRGVEKVDSIEYWQGEQDRLTEEIRNAQEASESLAPRFCAVVIFASKAAATTAAQLQIGPATTLFFRDLAGEPNAVNWPRISMKASMAPVFSAISWGMMFFFIVFWGGVVAAVMGLANLQSLADTSAFSWLSPVLDWPDAIVGLIEGLLPVVVLIVLNMLPVIIMSILVGRERWHSLNLTEAQFQTYIYIFSLFATFVYPVLGSALLNDIQGIINDPTSIPKILASAIPKGGFFFITLVTLTAFVNNSMELLQIVRLIVQPIFGWLFKTERGRRKTEAFGSVQSFPKPYAMTAVIFLLGIGYSSISPFICVVSTVYFGLQYVFQRYLLAYTMIRPIDGGGILFRGAFQQIMFSLFFKTLVMASLVGVSSSFAAVLEGLLIPVVIIANMHLRRKYDNVIDFGDFEAVRKAADDPALAKSYVPRYVNPALEPLPPYVNLSGVEAGGDDDIEKGGEGGGGEAAGARDDDREAAGAKDDSREAAGAKDDARNGAAPETPAVQHGLDDSDDEFFAAAVEGQQEGVPKSALSGQQSV